MLPQMCAKVKHILRAKNYKFCLFSLLILTYSPFLPQCGEKSGKFFGAFLSENAFGHLRDVIEAERKRFFHRNDGSRIFVSCAEDDPLYSRIDYCAGTHRAGLKRHIKLAHKQPPSSEPFAGEVDRFYFCVAKGVFIRFAGIICPCNDFIAPYDDRPDGHLADFRRLFGFL